MAGYPLRWGAMGCAAVMACGPSTGDGEGGASADGETGSDGGGMSLSASGEASGSDGSTTGTTATTETGTPEETGGSSSDEGPPTGCFEGEICGEFSVCWCSCDYDPRCCTCEPVECTEHVQCGDGASCVDLGPYESYECLPVPDCDGLYSASIAAQADLAPFAGATCLRTFEANAASLVDLADLQTLMYVHEHFAISDDATLASLAGLEALEHVQSLVLDGNAALTDVGALTGLQTVFDGQITNNPMLPAAAVHALLAGIEGGDSIQVCGNLDDVPC
jgi:hypothetical protein